MNGIAGAEIKMFMPGMTKGVGCALMTVKQKNCSEFWIVCVNVIRIGSLTLLNIMQNTAPALNLVSER